MTAKEIGTLKACELLATLPLPDALVAIRDAVDASISIKEFQRGTTEESFSYRCVSAGLTNMIHALFPGE